MSDGIPVSCSAPGCSGAYPVTGQWVQVDVPDLGFLAFCDLRCLYRWAAHHVVTRFGELGTVWWEKPDVAP